MCRSGFIFDFQSNEANRDMHCFNWFAFTPKKRDRFTQNYLFIDKNVLMSNAITIKNSNKINRTKAFTCYRLYRKKHGHSKLSDNFAAASETYIFNSNKFYLFSLYEHRTKHNNRLQYVIRIVIFNQLTIFLLSFV